MKTVTLSPGRTPRRVTRTNRKPQNNTSPWLRTILVPVDFSAPSYEAIEYAMPLVKKFGADLHLVHVFPPDYPLASMAVMPLIVPELQVGRAVRRQLKEIAAKYHVALSPGNTHAVRGRPFEEICSLAREIHADLIVLATRGLTGFKHLVLGSTAERVVRYSPCAVLVVRHPAGAPNEHKKIPNLARDIHRIAVPVDFSEASQRGLDYAMRLARRFNATLILHHSIYPVYCATSDEYTRFDVPVIMEQAEKAARAQLDELVLDLKKHGINAERSLRVGHPGGQICERALDGADLIVTSTHGRTGLKHVLVGSTAEYVVRHAACPVVVIPSHDRSVLPWRKGQDENNNRCSHCDRSSPN